MNIDDVKNLKLGYSFNHTELKNLFGTIWGGVAWPGQRPGFAVVVGIDPHPHFDSHDIYLLDECESFDMRQLIRQCGALDLKYGISSLSRYRAGEPRRWIGDYKNDAASRFIREMNAEKSNDSEWFRLNTTTLLEMEHFYPFALSTFKDLLNTEHRQLFLKDSKIVNYLSEIEESEIAELTWGLFPAIEALAFAVIELRNHIVRRERPIKLSKVDLGVSDDLIRV